MSTPSRWRFICDVALLARRDWRRYPATATNPDSLGRLSSAPEQHDSQASIFIRFLKFGALAWGGPAAQIAMIERECVDELGWVKDDTFKKTLAVYQILPGPEAHELCVYFGRQRGGKLGGFLAGLGFMLPGFIFDVESGELTEIGSNAR